MRLLWALSISVLAASLLPVRANASCGSSCPFVSVTLYDAEVQVPRPTDPNLVASWWGLFYASSGMNSYLSDHTDRECVYLLDGAFVNEMDKLPKDRRLRFGQEWANLPPASGPIHNGDYLVQSSVSGHEGAYVLNAKLQSGADRETVAQASVAFGSSAESISAGKKAGAQLAPLIDLIRTFQKKKRDADPEVAICGVLQVSPQEGKLKPGHHTEVELTLSDCDGASLKGRKLELKATHGSLSSSSVVTDAQGKAKVTFTAGEGPTMATISANYSPVKTPEGRKTLVYQEAAVEIGEPNVQFWRTELTVRADRMIRGTHSSTGDFDQEMSIESFDFGTSFLSTTPRTSDKSMSLDSSGGVNLQSSGSVTFKLVRNAERGLGGALEYAEKRNDSASGDMSPASSPSIYFSYDSSSGKWNVSVSADYHMKGEINDTEWRSKPDGSMGWITSTGKIDQDEGYRGIGGCGSETPGAKLTVTKEGFAFSCNQTIVDTQGGITETDIEIIRGQITLLNRPN